MKISPAKIFLLLVLGGMIFFFTGCASVEPENASSVPWNSPQGWEGGLNGMDYQHR